MSICLVVLHSSLNKGMVWYSLRNIPSTDSWMNVPRLVFLLEQCIQKKRLSEFHFQNFIELSEVP